jgi:hypothetical protein
MGRVVLMYQDHSTRQAWRDKNHRQKKERGAKWGGQK